MDFTARIALDVVQVIALVLLAAGLCIRKRWAHLLRAGGWAALGIFWGFHAPIYAGIEDWVNALGAGMALPIFCYLGYHEYLSHKWDDEYPPLRFVGTAMLVASAGYFIFDRVPILSGALILVVGYESVALVNLTGTNFGVSGLDYAGNPWYYRLNPDPAAEVSAPLAGIDIRIILACTAIQAFLILGAFAFASRAELKRKLLTFGAIAPVVYVANILRNALVIWLVHVNGPGYFDVAHHLIGKGLSLGVLVVLVLAAFRLLPELYEDINGLFDLFWRKGPGHDYLGSIGRVLEVAKQTPK
ncbi:MAG: archaeosortase A [Candidatus Thermoplasmatota archaeon]